ncbi:MAG: oligoribonuclease [Casimicrobiaceae bacterium]|nr:oligoribonuclease [Casimicrobiaceae bacterium]MCX8099101.1 oligoribonuclease [Casimicrobiaceae bacterium]MDW8312363.1 oligoribonuclease [Burkholderiales bacterium]
MPANQNHLVWLDMEMSGLDPETCRVLEVAVVVTDSNLETVAEGPVLAIHQPESVLEAMDQWNRETHSRTGLIERVRASTIDEERATDLLLEFLMQHVPKGASPLCGNSVHQDRRFMAKYMPRLEAYFHYRNLDVSTLKELAARWAPEVKKAFQKKTRHTALADIYESIEELRHYRDHFIRLPNAATGQAPAAAAESAG